MVPLQFKMPHIEDRIEDVKVRALILAIVGGSVCDAALDSVGLTTSATEFFKARTGKSQVMKRAAVTIDKGAGYGNISSPANLVQAQVSEETYHDPAEIMS